MQSRACSEDNAEQVQGSSSANNSECEKRRCNQPLYILRHHMPWKRRGKGEGRRGKMLVEILDGTEQNVCFACVQINIKKGISLPTQIASAPRTRSCIYIPASDQQRYRCILPQTTANLIFGTLLADVACSWVECSTSFFSERSVSCMPFLLWTVEKGKKSKVYVSGRRCYAR